jgi:glycosyltransferase involved in cell wall biosynthesis
LTAPGSRPPLRKVAIVNTADEGGGAERMSLAVLDGFADLGIETWLLVGDKKTAHPGVMPFYLSPFVDYRSRDLSRTALAARRRVTHWLGLEDFGHPYSRRILELTGSPPDLVLCHNLHGGYFDLRVLPALSRRVPVVVRLFDSWLLTGHCAYALGCPRWQSGCGRCPDLTIPPAIRRDATRVNWWRKRRILSGARLYVSAESRWMLDRARESLLAPAVAEWKLIPGGVDLATFSPGPQLAARREWGLPPDASILLNVANAGPENPLKDFPTIRQALGKLGGREPGRPTVLLAAGADGPDEPVGPGLVVRRLGYIRSPARLASLYRAADVYVHAAVEETFGLSVAEALASGLPVVTASRGGVLEIVEHERTALVVPPGDAGALADALARLLDDPARRAAMGAAAAASARARLDRRTMVQALHDWCADIHARWHARRHARWPDGGSG